MAAPSNATSVLFARGFRPGRPAMALSGDVYLPWVSSSGERKVSLRTAAGVTIIFGAETTEDGTLTIHRPTLVPPDRMERAIATEGFNIGTGE